MIVSRRNTLAPVAPLALTLAALGLAAAPAHAQSLTLNTGDSLTVGGTGTVGTQNGMPVANMTSAYTQVQTNGTSVFTLLPGGIINAEEGGTALDAEGSGVVTVNGGTIISGVNSIGLFDRGSGVVTVNGGTFSVGDSSVGLETEGSGAVTINGGTFSAGQTSIGLVANGSGAITINGGTFSAVKDGTGLFTEGSGVVTVNGGTFSGGKGGTGLDVEVASTINLVSQNDTPFLINGMVMNNVTLSSSLYQSRADTISGILANGDKLDTTFFDSATINLNTPAAAVPEASTTASFGLLLALGMGGVMIAAKKKTAAAAQETV